MNPHVGGGVLVATSLGKLKRGKSCGGEQRFTDGEGCQVDDGSLSAGDAATGKHMHGDETRLSIFFEVLRGWLQMFCGGEFRGESGMVIASQACQGVFRDVDVSPFDRDRF